VPDAAQALDRARRKAYRRLIPLLFLSYAIAYIDRTNVSFAKLTMSASLGLDNAQYALASGFFFFLGYLILEIPGSLIVERWSARRWVSRIMISWGIVAALTALVTTPGEFYAARFALGLAEAGFFPGIIVYLTHWFPRRDRARALAYFILAQPFAYIVGPPVSYPLLRIGTEEMVNGVLVRHPELLGLEGWQWVYIAWGLPAVVLGLVVWFVMPDRPANARWLTPDEREALTGAIQRERADEGPAVRHLGVLEALRQPVVLLLAAANFLVVIGHYGVDFFLPTILQSWYSLGLQDVTSFVVIPYIGLFAGFLVVSWSSDRSGERWLHTALPMCAGAGALALATVLRGHLGVTMALFTIAVVGIRIYLPPFYALPAYFLRGSAAAGAIGFINTIGNLGGAVGPYVIGAVETTTGGFEGGLYFLCGSILLSAVIILGLRTWYQRQERRAAVPTAAPRPASKPSVS
jgi:ACS family tartrate transporter-like MFS transporter